MDLAGKRILIVEDEALIALDTMSMLEDEGCVVVGPATRVEAALVRLEEGAIDGAVLDVNLKGTYVWPVAEALTLKGVPFIFVTGYGSVLDYPSLFMAVPRLDKPIDRALLIRTLKSL